MIKVNLLSDPNTLFYFDKDNNEVWLESFNEVKFKDITLKLNSYREIVINSSSLKTIYLLNIQYRETIDSRLLTDIDNDYEEETRFVNI